MINIIITHKGNPFYLKYVLRQLKQTNQDANIILLGDDSNNKYKFINHAKLSDYFNLASNFAKVYQHKNFTSVDYELFCYQRWFCAYEYMQKNNLDDAYMLDSDVLVYDNFKNLNSLISKYDFAVSVKNFEEKNKEPGDWIAGPPLGYFKKDTLKKLCDFFTASYSNKKYLDLFDEKMKYHETRGENFGICDMTQIYFFVLENQNRFFNLSSIFKINNEDTTIDLSILDTDNFVSENSHKKFIFKDDGVFAIPKTDQNKIIRFPLIHFQGYKPINAKKWIPLFYKGSRYVIPVLLHKLKFKIKLFKYLIQRFLFILFKCKIKGKNNKIIFPLKSRFVKKLKIKIVGDNNIVDVSNISNIKRSSKIKIVGDNNKLDCSYMTIEGHLYIETEGNNAVFKCNKSVRIFDTLYCYLQDDASVLIGERTSFFKTSIQSIHSGTSVIIGKNCMFSYDTMLYNSDGHPILDKDEKILNIPGNLELGDNVWVSWGASILKGVKIASNSIIGRGAVVSKSFDKERAVIAGNPAKICKVFEEGTGWRRDHKGFLKTHQM